MGILGAITLVILTFVVNTALGDNGEVRKLEVLCLEECEPCHCSGTKDFGELTEGDIITMRATGISLRSAFINKKKRWPENTVPYVFDENFSISEKRAIREAMNYFEEQTCVKFLPYFGGPAKKPKILYILAGKDCSSTLGYNKGRNYINLNIENCLEPPGKIHHQLLHILGLKHEHVRPDRHDYIDVQYKNIKPGFESYFRESNDKVFTTFKLDYDFNSTLHYPVFFLSKDGQSPTMVPKDNSVNINEIGQNMAASKGDLEKINIMYECPDEFLMYEYFNEGEEEEEEGEGEEGGDEEAEDSH